VPSALGGVRCRGGTRDAIRVINALAVVTMIIPLNRREASRAAREFAAQRAAAANAAAAVK